VFKISFVNLHIALSVFSPKLKPYWSVVNILYLVRYFQILVCITMSDIFENDVNTLRTGAFKLFKCTFPGFKPCKSTFILCFFKNL